MTRDVPSLPRRVHLPSGRIATLATRGGPAEGVGAAAALAWLERPGALSLGDGLEVRDLSLVDFHLLQALLARSGYIEESARTLPCDNCGAAVERVPSRGFEVGPFVDGELDDPELDAPFEPGPRPIPPVRTSKGVARRVVLAPRTVREAERLLTATSPLALDRSVVAALGIKALGEERTASGIANALAEASDEAWSETLAAWEDAHYSPRMFADASCAACGARCSFPVPADRELDRLAPPDVDAGASGGPPEVALDAFDALVRRHVERVFARRGLANIDVVVDDGVPFVDAGGEPLLGCYTPGDPLSAPPTNPEIRLFYRTFMSEMRRDAAFDLEDEIAETIDHEAEHHEHHLSGDDPLDDEERAEIVRERARLVGKSELARRGLRAGLDDVIGFARVALPLLVLLGLLAWLGYCH